MNLVRVTSKLRNGKAFVKDMLIDLDRITQPIFENVDNDTVLELNETPKLLDHVNQGDNNVQYVIDGDLSTFAALNTNSMILGTVVKRDDRIPVLSSVAFVTSKIVGKIEADALGSKFLYEEKGGVAPIEYIISETVGDIATAIA